MARIKLEVGQGVAVCRKALAEPFPAPESTAMSTQGEPF